MDLIILNDGLYQLIPVTKEVMEGIELFTEMSCFDLCDILRLKLTGYVDTLNLHIMNDGSGSFIGCMCRWYTYAKEGKISVGNGEKILAITIILSHCQIVSTGVQ